MTKITVNREALDRWHEALKSLDPHIQQLAVNALRATAAQPEQGPVGMVKELFTNAAWNRLDVPGSTKVYLVTPPAAQRQWVGLTDEDVNRESAPITSQLKLAFHAGMYVAQEILKERNT